MMHSERQRVHDSNGNGTARAALSSRKDRSLRRITWRTERAIRKQMEGLAKRSHKMFQWGVTLLLSFETALFFVRKEASDRMGIPAGAEYPMGRYLIGTVVLALLATILSYLTRSMFATYFYYASMLHDGPSHLPPPPRNPWVQRLLIFVYFLFPVLDFCVRLYVSLDIKFR
jgi:hypothetical protein